MFSVLLRKEFLSQIAKNETKAEEYPPEIITVKKQNLKHFSKHYFSLF